MTLAQLGADVSERPPGQRAFDEGRGDDDARERVRQHDGVIGDKAALDAMQMALSASKLTNAHEGAPTCSECGMLMVPNGACYKCENCGSTSGCS